MTEAKIRYTQEKNFVVVSVEKCFSFCTNTVELDSSQTLRNDMKNIA
jgi:hypothetical protein